MDLVQNAARAATPGAALGACLVGALMLTACGSGAASPPSPASDGTPTTAASSRLEQAARQYLDDVAPANAALAAFDRAAAGWTTGTTNAEAEAQAQPLIEALTGVTNRMAGQRWPSSASADIRALIGDLGGIRADLQGLSTTDLHDVSVWESTLRRDGAAEQSAVERVRHDLGLPRERAP